ncbi:MAG TPA: hypothetical protein VFJ90_04715, partial [Candidatus Didemnitutus sp.]|nr:hypothetical protein [Candidatus Didemnitutus sp.]
RANQGAKVHFSRLGAVSQPAIKVAVDGPAYPTGGSYIYTYTNGYVDGDSLRTNEVQYNADGTPATDANGKYIQTSTQGGRYTTNSGSQYDVNKGPILNPDGTYQVVTTGDYISYTPGQTRSYGFNQGGQVLEDGSGIVFSQYTTVSTGAELQGERGISAGFELSVARQMKKFAGGRVDFSLVGGIAMADINNKTAGTVHAKLHVVQDTFYFTNGGTLTTDVTTPFTAPTFTDYTDEAGNVHLGSNETTPTLADTPGKTVEEDRGAIDVTGIWKVRGAYIGLKAGPELRAAVSKNVGISLGAGVAGAYAATRFTAQEQFTIEGIDTPISVNDFSDTTKFLPGYYANADANYSVNERTGFYAGVGYEYYNTYDQTAGGRSAKIDLGSTATVHGGITIKF